MAKFKTLKTVDEIEFIFNSEVFKDLYDAYAKSHGITKEKLRFLLAAKCFKSDESIKKWYRGQNGPNDLDLIDTIADFFNVNNNILLKVKEQPYIIKPTIINREEIPMFRYENPIDITTLRFLSMLTELAGKLENGVIPFSQVTEDTSRDLIIYDDRNESDYYKIVWCSLVDELHHDIICNYDKYLDDYDESASFEVRLVLDEEDESYIDIEL